MCCQPAPHASSSLEVKQSPKVVYQGPHCKSVKFVDLSFVLCFLISFCSMKLYEVLCLLFVLKRWRSEAVSKPAPSRSTRKRQMRSASGTDSSSRTPRHSMKQSRNDSVEVGHSNIHRSLRSILDDLTIFSNIYFLRSTSFLDSSPQLQVLHLPDFASLSNVVIFLLELLNALLCAFFFHR